MSGASAGRLGSELLYSTCWEDLSVARAALRIPSGGIVVAVAAAGDNVIGLLLDDPARVVAVDLNPAQTALVELKLAAVGSLPGAVAEFLGGVATGAYEDARRRETYRRLRPRLSPAARAYWDDRSDAIAAGVNHAGRFERYVSWFRRGLLPIVPGRDVVRAMLAARTVDGQRRIYSDRWDTRAWRGLFRVFFSRRLLAALGRHPAFFDHAPGLDVGRTYLDRARDGLTTTPIGWNPYVTFALTGRYLLPEAIPAYLRPANADLLAARADRVEVRTDALLDVLRDLPDRSVDAFYLSDIFELSTSAEYAATLAEIARVGRDGGRLCYWNNLVDRRRPETLADRLVPQPDLATRLHAQDRAFLYERLVIEVVRRAPGRVDAETSDAA
jgi:S-adenosylmethionine-diacylglycerol 3-amino-3-carboxypropyl transferase